MIGSARRDFEAQQVEEALRQKEEAARKRLQLERRRREMEAQIENLRRQFEDEERETAESMRNVVDIDERARKDRDAMTRLREQDVADRSA